MAYLEYRDMNTLFNVEETLIQMPSEFKGKVTRNGGYTSSAPRQWTDEELEWIKSLKAQGYDIEYIAKSVGRTPVSVRIKLKRLGKSDGESYNREHRSEKYEANREFFEMVKPSSVLDMFSGHQSWYETNTDCKNVTTNDKEESFLTQYHESAERLIHKLYYEGQSYDLVDLDPFGSAYDCFDCAIKMAKKAIVITYGEMGHILFKRFDFVSRYYGINRMEDFTVENLIAETQRIAARSKKILTPVIVKKWARISRVYYTISDLKIISTPLVKVNSTLF